MNVTIQGRHMDVTPSLKEHIEKKMEKLHPFYEHIIDVNITLEVERVIHIAEVTIKTDTKTFFSEAKTEDMYESIDRLFEKLERQLKKYWEKITDRTKITSTAKIFQDTLGGTNSDNYPSISEIIEVSPKPMTDYEAILQMKLRSKDFYLYNNSKDDDFGECVAINNGDNDYLVIHPDGNDYLSLAVSIEDNKLIERESKKININNLTLHKAIDVCFNGDDHYLIYYDVDYHNLNVLFKKKNRTLGILTSASIDNVPTNVVPENYVM